MRITAGIEREFQLKLKWFTWVPNPYTYFNGKGFGVAWGVWNFFVEIEK